VDHNPNRIPHLQDLSEESRRNDMMCFIGKHNISIEATASESFCNLIYHGKKYHSANPGIDPKDLFHKANREQ
jgi:hypothetical protein